MSAKGVIEPDFLIKAYRMGIFPMALDDGEIAWFSPDPRGVIPLEEFHVPHGLKRSLREGRFEVRMDTAFGEVILGCADRSETWIGDEVVKSYRELHEVGYAHSVEAWREGKLAGGLYGVAIGGAFFGESMFSYETDASKVALVALVHHLLESGFTLLDTQWSNRHLEQFGCVEIPREEYMKQLEEALLLDVEFAG
ncbi:MAG: leucyl/phenylalanyl-tRNA--protein transferase [Verrucomicrobiota bacterium]